MTVIQLDLFELSEEWQEARDALDPEAHDLRYTKQEHDEARALDEKCRQLCDDLGLDPAEPSTLRWASSHLGISLIREDTFTDYAREFAEDLCADESGLMAYVDWDRYARDLRTDYYELTYDGHEWLRRA